MEGMQIPAPDEPQVRHLGQLSFHPSTKVVEDMDPVCEVIADRWAFVPVTWAGSAWWYGYGPLQRSESLVWGWWLMPRED